jgi:ubiquitin-protein ligase
VLDIDEAIGERVRLDPRQHEGKVLRVLPRGVVPTLKENLYHWELLIDGPQGSPYEGFKFILDVDFP